MPSPTQVLRDGFGGEIQEDGIAVPGASGGRCGARGLEGIAGRCGQARLYDAALGSIYKVQYKWKLTSTLICTATGLPSFFAGSKRQFFTASMAFSSRPNPRVRNTFMSRGLPSGPTTSHNTTVPMCLTLRASSEYSGSGE